MTNTKRPFQPFAFAVQVPAATIQNLFDSVQGGPYSGWCHDLSASVTDELGVATVSYDRENDAEGDNKGRKTLYREDISIALMKMAAPSKDDGTGGNPHHFARILNDDVDAATADVFLQFCVFGREIYG